MIPLLHDFTGDRVLVFGGGSVGARKARRFAREARTLVVSPAFTDRSFGDAELVRAAPEPDDVADWIDRVSPALVVAATSDESVNDAVASATRATGRLLLRADRSRAGDVSEGANPTAGDQDDATRADDAAHPDDPISADGALEVTTMATVTDEPVVVGLATGGAAPALAGELRRRIEPELDGAGAMARLLADLRPELKRRADPDARRAALREIASSPAVWKGLRTAESNGSAEARRIVEEYV